MRRQRPAILAEAKRRGCTPAQAEDVAENVVIELMRRIKKFRRRGNAGEFRKHIRRLTAWRAGDLLRKESDGAAAEGSGGLEDVQNPQDASMTAAFLEVMEICLQRLQADGNVSARDNQILRLLVVDGRSPDQVASLLRVPVPLVYLAKFRTLKKLRIEVLQFADQWE